jgi:ribosome biogenesis GTPase
VVGDLAGGPDSLARLVTVQPRTSLLRRTADDTDPVERNIVANAQQLLIVQALADPTPRIRFIDRCVIAALDEGIKPILILTKRDLADDLEVREAFRGIDLQIFTTQQGESVEELRDALTGKVNAVIGHSGVGKSTLVNALVPDAYRAIGVVNDVTGRGRHTSTSAIALKLPAGGWIIDTPGVRSFGLAHIDSDHVIRFFPELEAGTEKCPRACSHVEPDCGLDAWIEAEKIPMTRLDSLRRLITSIRSGASE